MNNTNKHLDLLTKNVNEYIEKKGSLSYLSWSWAWSEALKADEKATFEVKMFGELPYCSIGQTCMVWVTVTLFGKPLMCQLPVMDNRNKAISNPDAFDVNKAIMRCLAKAVALHGLGLYIYAGEDLPESESAPTPAQAPKQTNKPQSKPEITSERLAKAIAAIKAGTAKKEDVLNNFTLTDEQHAAIMEA